MRTLLIKIIQLLDGTPAVYGKRQSGQSVVELALITPILIVLLAGLVEIGWFANNYLTLLDVTRAGARRGAVLQDTKSPLFWDNTSSYVPTGLIQAAYQMPTTPENGDDVARFLYRWMPPGSDASLVPGSIVDYPCEETRVPRVFYNEVICTMITTMDPLPINPDNGIDDIIVSGFSVQMIDASANPTWLPGYDTSVPQMVVVGRYPTNANECNFSLPAGADPNDPGAAVLIGDTREGRDPFDFDQSNSWTTSPFVEIPGFDDGLTEPEKQVGFPLFGNHKIPNHACTGSEWTMQRVEDLMNLTNFVPTSALGERLALPSQGVILTEMYWEHEMLLKIPVLSPVFTVVGNEEGKMVINVWAAFPLSSVEPHIFFP